MRKGDYKISNAKMIEAIKQTGGNIKEASKILGIPSGSIYDRSKKVQKLIKQFNSVEIL